VAVSQPNFLKTNPDARRRPPGCTTCASGTERWLLKRSWVAFCTRNNEREIARWQSRITDTGKAALELALCLNAVEQLIRVWASGSDADRQSLVRGLFTSVTCDLDTRRITDFRLKPWAERYLVLRATLYDAAETTIAETKKTPSQREGVQQDMPLSGNALYPGYFHAQFVVNPIFCPDCLAPNHLNHPKSKTCG